MVGISSLGIGSGLDLGSLVDQLVAAQKAPTETRLNSSQVEFTSELSAFGLLRSSLSSFQSSLSSLSSTDSFTQRSSTSSDTTILTVASDADAPEVTAGIEVTQLAKSHSLASLAVSDIDASIGSGTLTIQFGTTSYDSGTDIYSSFTLDPEKAAQTITVSAENNNTTLSGLRDHINANDFGISASIVNDGSGYRLVLASGTSGASNSMEITVADTDMGHTDTSGLSQFAFHGDGGNGVTNLTQTQAAQDAQITINGLSITSSTNVIKDALQGITLNLLKASPGTTVTASVSASTTAAKASVDGFVSSYNGLIDTINSLTSFDSETQAAGILIGDSLVRTIESRVRSSITGELNNSNNTINSLVDIGITTGLDGKLSIDSAKLSTALSGSLTEVAALFAPAGKATDSQIGFSASTASTQNGNYAINVTTLATQGTYNGDTVLPTDFVATPLVIDTDNNDFIIKVDGIVSESISITQGSYTSGSTLASVIQSQINADSNLKADGVTVSVSYDSTNDRFDVVSTRYGSASTVEFVSVATNTAAELGFSISAGTAGVDVAGTINGFSATGSGQVLTSSGSDSTGLAVSILGGVTGSRGSISFSNGFVSGLDDLIDNFLDDNDGLIGNREDGLQISLDDLVGQREDLDLRISQLEARLISQFSALDALVAQLSSTSTFLSLQLASLPKPNTISNTNN